MSLEKLREFVEFQLKDEQNYRREYSPNEKNLSDSIGRSKAYTKCREEIDRLLAELPSEELPPTIAEAFYAGWDECRKDNLDYETACADWLKSREK